MTSFVIKRVATGKDGTFGVFLIDGLPVCVTLEDEWLNNARRLSCIPAGKYKVTPHSGPRFKDVWILHDVPGREAILIHWGNTNADTLGCILVGQAFQKIAGQPGITSSLPTVAMLRKILPREFDLEIVDLF